MNTQQHTLGVTAGERHADKLEGRARLLKAWYDTFADRAVSSSEAAEVSVIRDALPDAWPGYREDAYAQRLGLLLARVIARRQVGNYVVERIETGQRVYKWRVVRVGDDPEPEPEVERPVVPTIEWRDSRADLLGPGWDSFVRKFELLQGRPW